MSSASPVFNTTHVGGNAQVTNVNGDFNVVQNVYPITPDQEHRIYQWLGAPDSSGNFHTAQEKHHEQTGTWFIEGEEYRTWKETPKSALWVYGTPGCGKTIICSTVIEKIRAECGTDPSSACAYFFFDSRDAQTDLSLHNKLIRSIIRQLSHQSSGCPASLVELYGGGHEQPSITSLELTLQKILDGFEHV
ncbi:hypothetical protein FIBSPDRAFT_869589 [Athelia psychrophila]|uniref:Nephrocystin 3-like N-terminal domain-containing protein n=1 Tax=Athelia psychrophila TaxID=1759441 RepID=A0A166BZX7_9AGAM|nr:hypothetical protein FIBSPDRAFT_869589 [Fibularhizoctonia sp. CBS 109695]